MILIPDGVILIPQRSPKGRLLSATFLNMLLVPIFTDVGQILLQPTPSSVWRGASKRMRRPRSARIGGNTREGGSSWGLVQPLLASRELDPPRKVSLCWHGRFNDPKVDAASFLRSPRSPRAAAVPFPANMLPGKTHTRQPFVKHSLMGQVLTIKH